MTNSTRNFLKHTFLFSSAIFLLHACGGGERTTPYNTASSSSTSSIGAAVSVSNVVSNTTTATTITRTEKQHLVMRDATEFGLVTSAYVTTTLGTEDFSSGQVVLIDMGNTDSCGAHLNLNSVSAHEEGTLSVKLVVKYSETAAATTSCTSTTSRPYYFYYVLSRKQLIIEEDIAN